MMYVILSMETKRKSSYNPDIMVFQKQNFKKYAKKPGSEPGFFVCFFRKHICFQNFKKHQINYLFLMASLKNVYDV